MRFRDIACGLLQGVDQSQHVISADVLSGFQSCSKIFLVGQLLSADKTGRFFYHTKDFCHPIILTNFYQSCHRRIVEKNILEKYSASVKILFESILKIQNKMLSRNYIKKA